jgi:transcription elongation factor Elf1
MNCPACGSERVGVMAEDRIPCDTCEKTILMGYWICKNCQLCFRTANGRILNDPYVMKGDLIKETCEDLCKAVVGDAPPEAKMVDKIRHCIRCDSILVHEKKTNLFHCSDCEFEWEIL